MYPNHHQSSGTPSGTSPRDVAPIPYYLTQPRYESPNASAHNSPRTINHPSSYRPSSAPQQSYPSQHTHMAPEYSSIRNESPVQPSYGYEHPPAHHHSGNYWGAPPEADGPPLGAYRPPSEWSEHASAPPQHYSPYQASRNELPSERRSSVPLPGTRLEYHSPSLPPQPQRYSEDPRTIPFDPYARPPPLLSPTLPQNWSQSPRTPYQEHPQNSPYWRNREPPQQVEPSPPRAPPAPTPAFSIDHILKPQSEGHSETPQALDEECEREGTKSDGESQDEVPRSSLSWKPWVPQLNEDGNPIPKPRRKRRTREQIVADSLAELAAREGKSQASVVKRKRREEVSALPGDG
ncbi:hypothetical protein BC829DRAFT_243475 [Chytridium lagenaria]|nr:hypothetical protein BC829DRAFT_243475 [Chytridium lagenaria]